MYYHLKSYTEKLIYDGEDENDKMMYHRRIDITLNKQQNIFYKSTAQSLLVLYIQ